MDKKQIWQAILGEIEVTISKGNFVTWFSNTYIQSYKDGNVIVAVPNGFSKEWLENKYDKFIKEALNKYYTNVTQVEYKIISIKRPLVFQNNNNNAPSNGPHPIAQAAIAGNGSNLNTRYTFDNLIVGGHNELARAACEAVVAAPGEKYNPLFIYGGVGLGKTHLLQAIGNYLKERQDSLKIKYVTSEKFTSDLVNSIKLQNIDVFKNKYREINVLLIDDIQFIGGKEKTQEEFFHIFNALYHENKQIVICSDRPPKSISTLEERLRSRFEGGMIVDVTKPDFETRVAILAKKAKELNYPTIPQAVFEYIAKNVQTNVRELQGVLNKYIAICQLRNTAPSLNNAKEVLKDTLSKTVVEVITPDKIIDSVSEFFGIEPSIIKGKGRKSDIIKPRQLAIYLMRERLKLSYPCIGKELGGRDHATIIHAYDKICSLIKESPVIQQEVTTINDRYFS